MCSQTPQTSDMFSRLGTQGPASHVLCDFVSVCVGVMGEVWFSFFSYVSFHASVLYTCFSIFHSIMEAKSFLCVVKLHRLVICSQGWAPRVLPLMFCVIL